MYVIIVAGGKGLRMGNAIPKQFLPLHGKPVIFHTIERFMEALPDIKVIVVLNPDFFAYWEDLKNRFSFEYNCSVCAGGSERFYSVKNGIASIMEEKDEIVGIHDAVRPLVSVNVIRNLYAETNKYDAVIPTNRPVDSVRLLDGSGHSCAMNRNNVLLVQTPQVFKLSLLRKAYSQPYNSCFTDDASVVEACGQTITMIEGNKENIKITTPVDLKFAESLLSQ